MVQAQKNTADSSETGPGMDHHEFARQYHAVYPRLWLIAAGIVGDRTEADDIVQEAAVIAFRKLDSFEPGTRFGAWVARIVRFCAANHNRKSRQRRTLTTDPASLDQQADMSSSQAASQGMTGSSPFHSDFDDEMCRALNRLTPDARACLLLRVVDGLSYQEISELLEIPPGTAMSHVHRSRKQLRRGLRGDLASPKGGADE